MAQERYWPNISREDRAVMDRLHEVLSPDDYETRRQILAAEATGNNCYCRTDGRACVCTGGSVFQPKEETNMGTTRKEDRFDREARELMEQQRAKEAPFMREVERETARLDAAGGETGSASMARAAMITRKQNAYTPGKPSKAQNGGTVADPSAASPSPSMSRDPSIRGPQRDAAPQEQDPGNARETSFERAKRAGAAKAEDYERTGSEATDAYNAMVAKKRDAYKPAVRKG